jgi:cation:H+ antiporter
MEPPRGRHVWIQLALVLLGLVLLALGSRWLVRAAVTLAEAFGVSPLLIGLTIVAAGTSLPEVVTSVVAAVRRARELAVGNVVGSNIFNVLFILGTAAFVAPGGIAIPSSVRDFDLPVMLGVAVACLPVFFTHRRIARWEGALFLGYYGLYMAYLFLRTTGHPGLRDLEAALLGFVLPLTAITLLVLFLGARLRARS